MRGERCCVCWILVTLAGGPAAAQTVEVAGYGVAATSSEIGRARQARGLGLGADVSVHFGRVHLVARGLSASLRADFSVQPDYAVHQLEALAAYEWSAGLSFEVGVERRFISPDFQAQEMGALRVGVRSQSRLTSLAGVHASAAYLPLTRFSGGGGSDLAVELGLGLRIGRRTGRLSGLVEYSYQRIDREVNGDATPIRFSVARAGISARL